MVQGREPRHFLKMFNGKMVVFSGGKASGFKNITDHDTYDEGMFCYFCTLSNIKIHMFGIL